MRLSAIVAAAVVAAATFGFSGAKAAAMTSAQMTEMQQIAATTHTAQAAIQASPTDYKAMQEAIAMRSASMARTVLMKHGFTAAQLEGGVIMFSHAILPKKVQPHQFYYMEIDPKPFKLSVHPLPSQQ